MRFRSCLTILMLAASLLLMFGVPLAVAQTTEPTTAPVVDSGNPIVNEVGSIDITTTGGIAATTMFLVMALAKVINGGSLGKVPLWAYALIISVVLSLTAVQLGYIEGDLKSIIKQVITALITSHGLYQYVSGNVNASIGSVTPKLLNGWFKSSNLMLIGLTATLAISASGCSLLNQSTSPGKRLVQMYQVRTLIGTELVTLRKAGYIDDATALKINDAIVASDILVAAAERQYTNGDTTTFDSTLKQLDKLVDDLIAYQVKAKQAKAAKEAKPAGSSRYRVPTFVVPTPRFMPPVEVMA